MLEKFLNDKTIVAVSHHVFAMKKKNTQRVVLFWSAILVYISA